MKDLVARASIIIDAPVAAVWHALTEPELIEQYMFGTNVVSEWKVGSPIVWRGEWQGKQYEDKGVVLKLEPERTLQYSYFSPLSGVPDVPENYHIITVELEPEGPQTRVSLSQDGSATEEERAHSEQNWVMVLERMQTILEK
jgi:uncharacterized protein YndB with AHSA1/START domain